MHLNWDYNSIKEALREKELPAMLVNLDNMDFNIDRSRALAEQFHKKIRIATKSVRVPYLLKYILERGGETFRGLMCYSVREAAYLSEKGFDDLLVAYPTASEKDIDIYYKLRQKKVRVYLMVDSIAHAELITRRWNDMLEGAEKALLCIDADMSYRPAGMHLGVYRSSLLNVDDVERLVDHILQSKQLILSGVMGYEAQIAGMGEKNPFSPVMNPAKKLIKRLSGRDVRKKRKAIWDMLDRKGISLEFFNGGGTGSLITTSLEDWISEITIGSGFLQSHLFDYYEDNRNLPALCFALQVDRIPKRGVVTCKSGGFIASGTTGEDKSPLPFLPERMQPIRNEGFGEVQTPLRISAEMDVRLGDPLLFRPAKSGEIAEHFQKYLLLRDQRIEKEVLTYRGEGKRFF